MLVNTLPRVLQLTVLPDPAYQAREVIEGTWSLFQMVSQNHFFRRT